MCGFRLSKKYIAFMQIDESCRSYTVDVKCLSLRSAHFTPRIVVPNIKNKRNSHFIGLQTNLSRSVLLFECELRL